MSAPYDIYKFIIEPIRTADQPGLLLQRFMHGMQLTWNTTYDKIKSIPEISDWERTPDKAIRYLLWHVGLTSEYDYLVAGLSYNDMRRLASVMMAFWKQKGTQAAVVDLIRFTLAKKYVDFYDYFFFRWIVNESSLSELWDGLDSWVLDPRDPYYDEYRSLMLIEDTEHNINQTVLRNLANLGRPISERFDILLLDILENFDDMFRWTKISGIGTAKVEDGYMKFTSGNSRWKLDVPPMSDFDKVIKFKIKFHTGSSRGALVYFNMDAVEQNGYVLWLHRDLQIFYKVIAGVWYPMILAPSYEYIDLDVWYTFTIIVQTKHSGMPDESKHFILYADGKRIQDNEVDTIIPWNSGTIHFQNLFSAELWCDFLRVYPIQPRGLTVQPEGE